MSRYQEKNRELIIQILMENDYSLPTLKLKKLSKLANLYFFEALEGLIQNKSVMKINKENNSWIILSER
jgi:hypothetical protein